MILPFQATRITEKIDSISKADEPIKFKVFISIFIIYK